MITAQSVPLSIFNWKHGRTQHKSRIFNHCGSIKSNQKYGHNCNDSKDHSFHANFLVYANENNDLRCETEKKERTNHFAKGRAREVMKIAHCIIHSPSFTSFFPHSTQLTGSLALFLGVWNYIFVIFSSANKQLSMKSIVPHNCRFQANLYIDSSADPGRQCNLQAQKFNKQRLFNYQFFTSLMTSNVVSSALFLSNLNYYLCFWNNTSEWKSNINYLCFREWM